MKGVDPLAWPTDTIEKRAPRSWRRNPCRAQPVELPGRRSLTIALARLVATLNPHGGTRQTLTVTPCPIANVRHRSVEPSSTNAA